MFKNSKKIFQNLHLHRKKRAWWSSKNLYIILFNFYFISVDIKNNSHFFIKVIIINKFMKAVCKSCTVLFRCISWTRFEIFFHLLFYHALDVIMVVLRVSIYKKLVCDTTIFPLFYCIVVCRKYVLVFWCSQQLSE